MTTRSDPDEAFARVKALVIARTGHEYYVDKDTQLRERIDNRIAERGDATMSEYLARLLDSDADEWPLLESAITINETFFFRFTEQFDALRRTVLPELIDRRRTERRLRIWSVGCSTGAEPHSIAILLRDMLGDAIDDWKISLTGTDIDQAALDVARRGIYTSWSLRTLGEVDRSRFFDRVGEQYRLKDRYRGIARFERHNLLTMIDSAAPLNFADYDLILCRNVLIYFSHDHSTRIVAALARRLINDGLLFVGHAEPNPTFDEIADPVLIGGVLAYRQKGSAVAGSVPPELPAASVSARRISAPRKSPVRQAAAATVAPPAPVSAPSTRDDIRAELSSGNPQNAARLARIEADRNPRDAVAHYLAALGALAIGEREQAERGFRDALYLDTGFAMAHYLLGRHLIAQGRDVDGRRSLANALRVAATMSPDALLPEGDGLTAGSLGIAVRATLSVAA